MKKVMKSVKNSGLSDDRSDLIEYATHTAPCHYIPVMHCTSFMTPSHSLPCTVLSHLTFSVMHLRLASSFTPSTRMNPLLPFSVLHDPLSSSSSSSVLHVLLRSLLTPPSPRLMTSLAFLLRCCLLPRHFAFLFSSSKVLNPPLPSFTLVFPCRSLVFFTLSTLLSFFPIFTLSFSSPSLLRLCSSPLSFPLSHFLPCHTYQQDAEVFATGSVSKQIRKVERMSLRHHVLGGAVSPPCHSTRPFQKLLLSGATFYSMAMHPSLLEKMRERMEAVREGWISGLRECRCQGRYDGGSGCVKRHGFDGMC